MLRADKAFRAARLKKAEPEYMRFRLSCATARGYCRGVPICSGGSPSPCLSSIVTRLRADKALCAARLKKGGAGTDGDPAVVRYRARLLPGSPHVFRRELFWVWIHRVLSLRCYLLIVPFSINYRLLVNYPLPFPHLFHVKHISPAFSFFHNFLTNVYNSLFSDSVSRETFLSLIPGC